MTDNTQINDEVSKSDNSVLLTVKANLIISQFLDFAQKESVGLCYLFVGDDPQELTARKVIRLKDSYLEELSDS